MAEAATVFTADRSQPPGDATYARHLALLQTAPLREARLQAWLALELQTTGAEAGAIWDVTGGARKRIATAGLIGQSQSDALEEAALLALSDARPIARGRSDVNGAVSVAMPVISRGVDPAKATEALVVALLLPIAQDGDSRNQAMQAIRHLQWGTGWLQGELTQRIARDRADADARAGQIVDLIADVLPHGSYTEAATAAVTALALRHDCIRVAWGHRKAGTTRVAAISHSAKFGEKMNLVSAISSAMDEAIDQQATILFPTQDDRPLAIIAHRALAKAADESGAAAADILTIPAFVADRFIGAFTFQRGAGEGFTPETIAILDAAVTTLAPILEDKRLNDRWIGVKLWSATGDWIGGLFGPTHAMRKLAVLLLAAATAASLLITAPYRVTADASLQGSERRAIAASYDGYLQASDVRSGQAVQAGELLALLDDRELALERLRRETERAQFARQYDDALAARQPALANVIRNQIEQADAQIALLDERLQRTRITAPFDGFILSEDLSQRIGSVVNRGEVLFEISPLDGYRIILQVDERMIGDLEVGQTGEIVFTAIPRDVFPIEITAITPVAQVRDGMNRFTVEADLTDASDDRLRPGMTGIAKVEISRQSLLELAMRPISDWFHLARWRWLG